MNTRDKCQTCWYSRSVVDGDFGERSIIECHRQPPLPKSEHTQSGWPAVDASDWCGEYKNADES